MYAQEELKQKAAKAKTNKGKIELGEYILKARKKHFSNKQEYVKI